MTALVSCPEAARLDAETAKKAAIPSMILMEDASVELWRALAPLARALGAGDPGLLLALCGPGNNGGDALALLRHARFSGLSRIAAILSPGKLGELGSLYAASLDSLGIPILKWEEGRAACERLISEASLIVDGVAGSGLKGQLRESLSPLLAAIKSARAPVASIDLPSGLGDDFAAGHPIVAATWTLSIEPRKACLYYPSAREYCGEILPIEGVFPVDAPVSSRAALLCGADLRSLARLPPDSAYKGSRGRVAVFAGSVGASGAAVLSSRSCLAAGAGVAALFASKELLPIVAPMLEAVMVKPEPEMRDFESDRWDALLVGPGWGQRASRLETLASLLGLRLPSVLDADAISLYGQLLASGFSPSAPVILTPHPGEFEALTGIPSDQALANPAAVLPEAARAMRAVIALKSQVTWIASPDGEVAAWDGRESGLGTAGSGDVLAGLAAGLLARSSAGGKAASMRGAVDAADGFSAAFSAARAAVIAHGLAGRRARSKRGWFEAGAIIEEAARILGEREATGA